MTYEVRQCNVLDGSPVLYKLATFQHRDDAIRYADARAAEHETKNHGYQYRVYEVSPHINRVLVHRGGQE